MRSNRPTVADLRAMKGKKQLSKIRVFTMEEVEAAARAGVEILSVTPELIFNPAVPRRRARRASPSPAA